MTTCRVAWSIMFAGLRKNRISSGELGQGDLGGFMVLGSFLIACIVSEPSREPPREPSEGSPVSPLDSSSRKRKLLFVLPLPGS
jgi:hypothetical protein